MNRGVPSTLADIDRITDILIMEEEDLAPDSPFKAGGAGARAFYGASASCALAGTELEAYAQELYEESMRCRHGRKNFRVAVGGRTFRANRGRTRSGYRLSLRQNPTETPLLNQLRIRQRPVSELLMGEFLNGGGLVLFAALTGQGKSTLAAATMKSRLEKYGGRLVTAEEPIELPLEGVYSSGAICDQFEVEYDDPDPAKSGFAGAIRESLRRMPAAKPAMLFVGEIRDRETAVETIKASLSGLLVFATIHAESTSSALRRLMALAETDLGAATGGMLGSALRIAIHQSLTIDPSLSGWQRGLYDLDMILSLDDTSQVAISLREGRLSNLNGIAEQQRTQVRLADEHGTGTHEVLRNMR